MRKKGKKRKKRIEIKNIRNNQSNIETKKKNKCKKWKTEKENTIWFRNQQFWGLCNYLIRIDKVDSTAQTVHQ